MTFQNDNTLPCPEVIQLFLLSSAKHERFSEDFFCEMPMKFSKSNVPGPEMTFIAVEKLVSIVFRHVIFCVTQAVTSL